MRLSQVYACKLHRKVEKGNQIIYTKSNQNSEYLEVVLCLDVTEILGGLRLVREANYRRFISAKWMFLTLSEYFWVKRWALKKNYIWTNVLNELAKFIILLRKIAE